MSEELQNRRQQVPRHGLWMQCVRLWTPCFHFWRQCYHGRNDAIYGYSVSVYGCSASVYGRSAIMLWMRSPLGWTQRCPMHCRVCDLLSPVLLSCVCVWWTPLRDRPRYSHALRLQWQKPTLGQALPFATCTAITLQLPDMLCTCHIPWNRSPRCMEVLAAVHGMTCGVWPGRGNGVQGCDGNLNAGTPKPNTPQNQIHSATLSVQFQPETWLLVFDFAQQDPATCEGRQAFVCAIFSMEIGYGGRQCAIQIGHGTTRCAVPWYCDRLSCNTVCGTEIGYGATRRACSRSTTCSFRRASRCEIKDDNHNLSTVCTANAVFVFDSTGYLPTRRAIGAAWYLLRVSSYQGCITNGYYSTGMPDAAKLLVCRGASQISETGDECLPEKLSREHCKDKVTSPSIALRTRAIRLHTRCAKAGTDLEYAATRALENAFVRPRCGHTPELNFPRFCLASERVVSELFACLPQLCPALSAGALNFWRAGKQDPDGDDRGAGQVHAMVEAARCEIKCKPPPAQYSLHQESL
eukprot:3260665-Rhodomonas_salina.3